MATKVRSFNCVHGMFMSNKPAAARQLPLTLRARRRGSRHSPLVLHAIVAGGCRRSRRLHNSRRFLARSERRLDYFRMVFFCCIILRIASVRHRLIRTNLNYKVFSRSAKEILSLPQLTRKTGAATTSTIKTTVTATFDDSPRQVRAKNFARITKTTTAKNFYRSLRRLKRDDARMRARARTRRRRHRRSSRVRARARAPAHVGYFHDLLSANC